ncbi:amino acid permease [bacterium]|nr:amino acid permease [bacterium]
MKNRQQGKLKRELGLFDVYSIAAGAMISSGIFILPGLAHARAGPAVAFSYFLAGCLAATGVLSQAELASAMPRAGGTYFYITRSLGAGAGTAAGLMLWLSLALKSSFALIGMAVFIRFFTTLNISYIAMGLTVFFVILNILGVKEAAKFQVTLVIGLLALLMFYLFIGTQSMEAHKILPFVPNGWRAVFSTAGFVFISYGGVLKIAAVAEEVKNPGKTIPKGMILALISITVLYTLVVLVTAGVLDASKLDNSLHPIYDGAVAFFGKPGGILMAIAAILAFISTANAGIMAASRYPVAMARDKLLPPIFSRINEKRNTPVISIVFTGAIMIAVLSLNLESLVKTASTVLILTFIFDNLNVIVMRESRVGNYLPQFKSPLYPWLQIAGIIGFGFLIVEMGILQIIISAGLVIIGFLWYSIYGRLRTAKDSALMRLLARITSKELTKNLLETELRQIIRERDGIVTDRYDKLVEQAPVLDIDEQISMHEFFKLAAEKLAPILDENSEIIHKLLVEREQESTTILTKGLAIPHIIIDGSQKFAILLARAKNGIMFPESSEPVNILIVMAGSQDERNFYLKSLAATVEAINSSHFEKKWLLAKNEHAFKDIIIFGRKRRFI